jgi:hypothetical protein
VKSCHKPCAVPGGILMDSRRLSLLSRNCAGMVEALVLDDGVIVACWSGSLIGFRGLRGILPLLHPGQFGRTTANSSRFPRDSTLVSSSPPLFWRAAHEGNLLGGADHLTDKYAGKTNEHHFPCYHVKLFLGTEAATSRGRGLRISMSPSLFAPRGLNRTC